MIDSVTGEIIGQKDLAERLLVQAKEQGVSLVGPESKRRLEGVDQIVLSLSAHGLTTDETAAHFNEVCGAKVSKDTISRNTGNRRESS